MSAKAKSERESCNRISPAPCPATKKEIAKRLYVLAEALGETLSENRIDIYLQALSDLPVEHLLGVLRSMISTERWFPKIAEIRKAVLGEPEDWATLEAEKAWENVKRIFSQYWWNEDTNEFLPCYAGGSRHEASPLDAVTDYALRQVGYWNGLSACKPENTHFQQRDFVNAYVRYTRTEGLKRLPSRFDECDPHIAEAMKALLKS